MKAIWNDVVLAESNETIQIEGNHYFPNTAMNKEYFTPTQHHTVCGWKGDCSYYSIDVNGKTNENATWYYPNPKDAAKEIKNYVAFWKGVQVVKS